MSRDKPVPNLYPYQRLPTAHRFWSYENRQQPSQQHQCQLFTHKPSYFHVQQNVLHVGALCTSASSCVHGARPNKFAPSTEVRTSLPSVVKIAFPTVVELFVICYDKQLNSSVLFSSTRRKPFQSIRGTTRLRIPFPRFYLMNVFKLLGTYTSQTISILSAVSSCGSSNGVNTR